MSVMRNVRYSKCPYTNCPYTKCPYTKCPPINNVYRKSGEILIIILKVLALDLPGPVKKTHLGSKKR